MVWRQRENITLLRVLRKINYHEAKLYVTVSRVCWKHAIIVKHTGQIGRIARIAQIAQILRIFKENELAAAEAAMEVGS